MHQAPLVEAGLYRNHKGNLYRVLGSHVINKNNGERDGEREVRYVSEPPEICPDDGEVIEYVRSAQEFTESVPDPNNPGQMTLRFKKL